PLEAQVERALSPFQYFIRNQTTGSVLLLLCTLAALVIANSPLAHDYEALLDMPLGLVFGDMSFEMSLHHWINDGLMALFFFVLGLEIKREILVGELKQPRQSLPVVAAALGGMLAPSTIFLVLNADTASIHGWGIPMATDTAFAIGILMLLGRRIPPALITFLTALAIIDDLGAILVIALFYTQAINLAWLGFAGISLLLLIGCNASGLRHPLVYLIGGGIVWVAVLGSGVHATVAGVLVALIVPARPKREPHWFIRRARRLIDRFESIEHASDRPILGDEEQHAVAEKVQETAEKATTPLRRWENALEYPVALLVMPLFALTNAGVPIDQVSLAALWSDRLSLGVILGLVAGKAVGITALSWVVLRLRLGELPAGVTMRHIAGIALLGGMGFTMSIFIAGLGFADNPDALAMAKTAILIASSIAGLSGYLWLRLQGSSTSTAG
ncbi:MAG: Na+/H+ antiporter NhaA, partial [Gammaproteobacteria bacterium]